MGLFTKKWSIPEVIQVSTMDCGPACLKSIAAGFSLDLDYDRLRSLCNTGMDGSSITDLEKVLASFGFEVTQQAIPWDFIIASPSQFFPAITFIEVGEGSYHFNIIWRKFGDRIQIMDPGIGRKWVKIENFSERLHTSKTKVDSVAWYEFGKSNDFLVPLAKNMSMILRLSKSKIDFIISRVVENGDFRSLSALDALVRFVGLLKNKKLTENHSDSMELFFIVLDRVINYDSAVESIIPKECWYANFFDKEIESSDSLLLFAPVLVTIKSSPSKEKYRLIQNRESNLEKRIELFKPSTIFSFVRNEPGLWSFLSVSAITSSAIIIAQAFIFKLLTHFIQISGEGIYKIGVYLLFVSLMAFYLFIDFPTANILARIGRKIDSHYRINFSAKLMRIRNEYFETRLKSDVVQRIHSISGLRSSPHFLLGYLESHINLITIFLGLIYLYPEAYLSILCFLFFMMFLSAKIANYIQEIDFSKLTNSSSLNRFNIDALFGAEVLSSHYAYRSFLFEYKNLLSKWMSSSLKYNNVMTLINGVFSLVGVAFCCVITFFYLTSKPITADAYLFVMWMLSAQNIVTNLPNLTGIKANYNNLKQRLDEPIRAEEVDRNETFQPSELGTIAKGFKVQFRAMSVSRSGRSVLSNINLSIESGEHVAIVGSTGSGKSTLLGCLLGKWVPKEGEILINDIRINSSNIMDLFPYIAWIDPDTKIWNKSLLDNILYSTKSWDGSKNKSQLDTLAILPLIEALPQGSQTILGEDGGTISGGEAQRIRFARAINQNDVRLALLDEPLRGLEKDTRIDLLYQARNKWKSATLLCAMHEISLAAEFDRVLVVENGLLIEDGDPKKLIRRNSRFNELFRFEQQLNIDLWKNNRWKKFYLNEKKISSDDTSNPLLNLQKGKAI
ncbi:MAG: ATP-binding cassette domain-containing protein [Oligoflexales bacterium]|nr:ATP-binding cassette domain-containing protein [Oligoflexales bacterium]